MSQKIKYLGERAIQDRKIALKVNDEVLFDGLNGGELESGILEMIGNSLAMNDNQKELIVGKALSRIEVDDDDVVMDSYNHASIPQQDVSKVAVTVAMVVDSAVPLLTGSVLSEPTSRGNIWNLFSLHPITKKDTGEIESETLLTPINFGSKYASKARNYNLKYDPAVTEYNIDVKDFEGDVTNAKIARNTTMVRFYADGDFQLKDLNSRNKAEGKDTQTIDTGDLKLTIVYADGTIKIEVPANSFPANTPIIVQTSLDLADIENTRGEVGYEVLNGEVIARPISLKTVVNSFNEDENKREFGFSMLPLNLSLIMQKETAEIRREQLDLASGLRTLHDKVVEVTETGASNRDIYQKVLAELVTIKSQMITKSMMADSAFIVGGSGLEKIYSMMMDRSNAPTTQQNGVRVLGTLGREFLGIYDPRWDIDNPLVDSDGEVNANPDLNVYTQIGVYGTSTNLANRIILSDVVGKLRVESTNIKESSNIPTWIEGKYVNAINSDPRVMHMAKTLLVKLS